jgi:hypothetical protein
MPVGSFLRQTVFNCSEVPPVYWQQTYPCKIPTIASLFASHPVPLVGCLNRTSLLPAE